MRSIGHVAQKALPLGLTEPFQCLKQPLQVDVSDVSPLSACPRDCMVYAGARDVLGLLGSGLAGVVGLLCELWTWRPAEAYQAAGNGSLSMWIVRDAESEIQGGKPCNVSFEDYEVWQRGAGKSCWQACGMAGCPRSCIWGDWAGAIGNAVEPASGRLEQLHQELRQRHGTYDTAPGAREALPSASACSWWWCASDLRFLCECRPPSAAAARAARCKRATATTCAPAHSRSLRPAEALPGGLRVGRLDGLVQLHGALPAVRQQDQDQEEVGALLRW